MLPRVLIEDVRGDGRFLRVTLHPESDVIVISHWEGETCVAATRVPTADVGDLIELLREARPDG